MLRRLGLAISYFIAIVYVLSILLPSIYCYRHGCKGPDLDAFMPAFALIPFGGVLVAQRHTAHQKRRIVALGFLARRNCFRDDAPRYSRLYRDPDLLHRISSSLARRVTAKWHSYVAQPLLAVRTLSHLPSRYRTRRAFHCAGSP